jgi:hypothetical protein
MTEQEIRDAKYDMIGALAYDIRQSWANNTYQRLQIMCELCKELGEKGWRKTIKEDWNDIVWDGRYFRDWDGPYGGTTRDNMRLSGYDDHVFECPEYVISDHSEEDSSKEEEIEVHNEERETN